MPFVHQWPDHYGTCQLWKWMRSSLVILRSKCLSILPQTIPAESCWAPPQPVPFYIHHDKQLVISRRHLVVPPPCFRKCCSCALGTPIPAFSALLSARHYLGYSSGRCYLLKGAFAESRPCPFHEPPWTTWIHPSEHPLHCLVAANRSFCLSENTALTPRQEGPFPPHNHLTWVLYLKGLSASSPAEPLLHEATSLRSQGDVPSWSPGAPSCATPCGTRTPNSRTPCPTWPKACFDSLGFFPKFILLRENHAPETTLLGMKYRGWCL